MYKAVQLAFAILVVALSSSCSRAGELKEGEDYLVIESSRLTATSPKIGVTEFFSYQCPHCFAFSKPLRDWSSKLPSDVLFERESVSIGHEPWIAIARSYYALRAIGKVEALDAEIFNAIHEQGVRLNEAPYIMGWLNQHNVAPTEFDTAYRSQKVRDDYARGEKLSLDYKIPSIPIVVIDDKYMVIIVSNVDFAQQLTVVDKLIAKARAERTHQK